MPSEATLVRKIMKAVRLAYPAAYVRKLADKYNRGMPDILILARSVLFVETKTPKGRLSKIQLAELELIMAAGGEVLVAKTVEEVLDKLEEMGAMA